LLRHRPPSQQGRFYRWSESMFNTLIAQYSRSLRWVLRHQVPVLVVASATLVLAIYLYVVIPKGLFPTQDVGIIQGISQAPESISFQAMAVKQQQLARIILQDPAVASLSSFIGVDGTNATLNSGRIQINLKPFAERHVDATTVIGRLNSELRKVEGIHLYLQPVQDLTVDDRASRNQFQYTLEDFDQAELDTWTEKMVAELRKQPELRDVATDGQLRGLAENLVIDRATASRMSITPDDVDSTLYDAFGQRQIGTLYTQTNQYHVILEASPEFQKNPQKLQDIYLQSASSSTGASPAPTSTSGRTASNSTISSMPTLSVSSTSGIAGSQQSSLSGAAGASVLSSPTSGALSSSTRPSALSRSGASSLSAITSTPSFASSGTGSSSTSASTSSAIPLSAIAHFEKRSSPLTIAHQGQFPVVTISFNLAPNTSLSQAVAAVERVQNHLNMPASVQASFQGTAEAYKAIGSNEALLILAALVAVYIVLGVLYESFIHPITILSTLPSAGVGALLALMLFKQDLGIVAIIGIILLIGIVKKNGIMIVDFALEAERTRGLSSAEAIFEASRLRFRPILMTTLAALFAGIPLAFGSGIGSELRRPLGIAMVGGLLLSQILTLYTTPVIYILFDRLASRLSARKGVRPVYNTAEQL
jgi:multidrug efflux pump